MLCSGFLKVHTAYISYDALAKNSCVLNIVCQFFYVVSLLRLKSVCITLRMIINSESKAPMWHKSTQLHTYRYCKNNGFEVPACQHHSAHTLKQRKMIKFHRCFYLIFFLLLHIQEIYNKGPNRRYRMHNYFFHKFYLM